MEVLFLPSAFLLESLGESVALSEGERLFLRAFCVPSKALYRMLQGAAAVRLCGVRRLDSALLRRDSTRLRAPRASLSWIRPLQSSLFALSSRLPAVPG